MQRWLYVGMHPKSWFFFARMGAFLMADQLSILVCGGEAYDLLLLKVSWRI